MLIAEGWGHSVLFRYYQTHIVWVAREDWVINTIINQELWYKYKKRIMAFKFHEVGIGGEYIVPKVKLWKLP